MSITLTGNKTESFKVEVELDQALREVRAGVLLKLGVRSDQYVSNGYLYEEEDYGHGSPSSRKLCTATPKQIAVWEVFSALNKLMVGVI